MYSTDPQRLNTEGTENTEEFLSEGVSVPSVFSVLKRCVPSPK